MTPRLSRIFTAPRHPPEPLERRAYLSAVVTATPLPAVSTQIEAAPVTVDLSADFTGADVPTDTVIFDTTLGRIPVELTPAATPLTVANFLSYVTAGSYDDSFVHRSVDGPALDIWQGGSYTAKPAADGTFTTSTIVTGPPVANEYAMSHPNVRGTIAMAKLGGDPNSATDGWFFNVGDNTSNLDNQNGGFTTFGNVIGNGLAVMDAIAAVPTYNLGKPFDTLPLVNYTAGAPVALGNLVEVTSVRQASAYTVTSDDPAVVTATVAGGALTYSPVAAGVAHLTVTAAGVDGSSATQTFAVTVIDPTIGLLPQVTASTVPATTVAGAKVKGTLSLTLTNTAAAVDKGTNTVQVYAVPAGSTDTSTAALVATAKVKTNLAPHAVQRLSVPVRTLPRTSGGYTLLVRTTNVAGTAVTAATGPTVTVAAPVVTLAVSVAAVPSTAVPGRAVTYTLTLSNTGNIDATGPLTANVSLSVGGAAAGVPAATATRVIRVKAGGKSVVLRLKAKLPSATPEGAYQLLATIVQQGHGAAGLGTSPLIVGSA